MSDEESEDELSEEEEEEEELDPVLKHYSFPHFCGGNNCIQICYHNWAS